MHWIFSRIIIFRSKKTRSRILSIFFANVKFRILIFSLVCNRLRYGREWLSKFYSSFACRGEFEGYPVSSGFGYLLDLITIFYSVHRVGENLWFISFSCYTEKEVIWSVCVSKLDSTRLRFAIFWLWSWTNDCFSWILMISSNRALILTSYRYIFSCLSCVVF